jgi:HK97 gp10 family phage protein
MRVEILALVEFLGSGKLIARLARLAGALDPAAAEGIKRVAYKIKDTAQVLVRVDTASLQKSIRVGVYAREAGRVHSIRVTAGGYVTNPKTGKVVDYAADQEYGTSKMSAQPYMGPAVAKHGPEIPKIIKEGIME